MKAKSVASRVSCQGCWQVVVKVDANGLCAECTDAAGRMARHTRMAKARAIANVKALGRPLGYI